jgi:hypothetical protein
MKRTNNIVKAINNNVKNRKQEVSIVNLSTYTSPKVSEVRGKDWVSYGADNNYYQFLIDRYNGSPTNNAIINGISEMIYGKGLDATDSNRKPDQYAQMKTLFNKDCTRKLVYDLKLMGGAAMQVIYSKDRSKIVQVEHMPVETIRAEKCNEDGDIEAYYYFKDWTKIKPSDEPQRIPAFGFSKEAIEILFVKPYRAGFYYYSPVDYQGGLQYAELEEEISNYHLNNIMNGLAPSMLINFNNGVPNEEERQLIENKIHQKFAGSSNSGKFILSFNDNAETAASIEPVQLSDAHQQYQFLSDESSKKIMVSHRVVSPMLLGIKDSSGLGNNAEEIETASTLMDNTVIRPFQTLLIDAFDQVLSYNNISLNLYFKTLQPLEFTDLDNVVDKETREEETGVKMQSEIKMSSDKPKVDDGFADFMVDFGEDENLDEWELVDERPVDYDTEETLDKMIGLASTGSARPNAKSEQDGEVDNLRFKVRYQYAPLQTTQKDGKNVSREFCKKMVAAKKIYRKEDVQQMSQRAVNAGWGKGGADTYDIWLYKGGGDCHHFWMRKTYMAKGVNPDTSNPNAEISVNQAKKDGFTPEVNDKKVAKRPTDMPNNGFVKKR